MMRPLLFMLAAVLAWPVAAQSLRTTVPERAHQYLPMVAATLDAQWPDLPERAWVPALIEHESGCFALKTKCWNPRSRLLTKREEGAGLGQITRAYRPDGTLRFDKLAELRAAHRELRELAWSTVYDRPDLQITAVALLARADWRALAPLFDGAARLHATDAAYNGGRVGVLRERQACAMTAGCNPRQWLGHVEAHCLKSHHPLYAGRSACDINRHHVRDVFTRVPKYRGLV